MSTLRIPSRYWRRYPPDEPLGSIAETIDLDVDESVLLLIDVYGLRFGDDEVVLAELPEFYKPTKGDPFRDIVRNRIVPARDAARRAGVRVVYLANYLSPGLSSNNVWRTMSIRTTGIDVLEAWRPPTPILEHAPIVAPGPDEPLIQKQFYSGFFETSLDSTLRAYGTKNIVAVGFDSQICLAATLTDALYRNYRVVALRDAIRTVEYPETEGGEWANFMAIRHIEANIGHTALTNDFIAACETVVAQG